MYYSDTISNKQMNEYYNQHTETSKHYSDTIQDIQFLTLDGVFNRENNKFDMKIYILNKSDEKIISIDGKITFYRLDHDVYYENLIEIPFKEEALNSKTKKLIQVTPSNSNWNFFEVHVCNVIFENKKIENKIFKSKRFFRNSAWIFSYLRLKDNKLGPLPTPFNLYWIKEKIRTYKRRIYNHCRQRIFLSFEASDEDWHKLKVHMRWVKINRIVITLSILFIGIVLSISIYQLVYVLFQLFYLLGNWITNLQVI